MMIRDEMVFPGAVNDEVVNKIRIVTEKRIKDISTDVGRGGYKLRLEDEVAE